MPAVPHIQQRSNRLQQAIRQSASTAVTVRAYSVPATPQVPVSVVGSCLEDGAAVNALHLRAGGDICVISVILPTYLVPTTYRGSKRKNLTNIYSIENVQKVNNANDRETAIRVLTSVRARSTISSTIDIY